MSPKIIEWFDDAMKRAEENERRKLKGNAYLDKLQAGGSLPGMLRFMAKEYTGPSGQAEPGMTANQLKRAALLKAASLIENLIGEGE